MADVFSKRKRSQVMAAIRSKGNRTTELRLVTILRAAGITGWRRHLRLPGSPDFAFPAARLAVFVDGCFWHGCKAHCRIPKSRRAFWRGKISRNMDRDKAAAGALRRAGWRVARIWEHALHQPGRVTGRLARLLNRRPDGR